MPTTLPSPTHTRLVTIVAQVDHGKTTLADSLIESNGIISERMAGSIRFLDALAEEQRRGITMRASAIGLKHLYTVPKIKKKEEMVIHLIDSPGHIDFSMEVTSSLLLCDGALLVVDAVEGMCARTHMILREAYAHELVPVLVLNKIDKLCLDLCLTPTEAYMRLRALIENVNAAAAALIISNKHQKQEEEQLDRSNDSKERDEEDEEEEKAWNFDPARGNVLFASAFFGWGFSVPSLTRSLFQSKAIPFKPQILKQYLFADCKYNKETKKMTKWKQDSGDREDNMPVFAEYALKPLWEIYEGVDAAAAVVGLSSNIFADSSSSSNTNQHKGKSTKIKSSTPGMDQVLNALQIGNTTPPSTVAANNNNGILNNSESLQSVLNSFSSVQSILRAILRRYRPLSDAVLDAVCEHCPSPSAASSTIRKRALALQPGTLPNFEQIQRSVKACDESKESPTVAHVCKFLATHKSDISDPELSAIWEEEEEENDSVGSKSVILGLARVLSGTLYSKDVEYYMYGPKHKETDPSAISKEQPTKRSIRLYLLMGSSFVRVKSVPAGHICAIYDLEDLQLKTVTLCDTEGGMPLCGFGNRGLQPLVKVNIEPVVSSDTDALERGLLKLSLADASVQVTATSRGERLLACLGEIHLEQSINDLETIYCVGSRKASDDDKQSIPLRISDPIVEFGETTAWFDNEMDYQNFIDDAEKQPPLRQVSVPPYCDEEGLGNALRGRSRSIMSGRGAAISLRVIPLSRLVFDSLGKKKMVNGSEEDIVTIGKALNITSSSDETPENILNSLIALVCALDANGNALIETSDLSSGKNVKSVITGKGGEVYSPPPRNIQKSSFQKPLQSSDYDIENEENNNEALVKYKALRTLIRNHNDGNSSNHESLSEETTTADQAAKEVWKSQMRGSAVAGFQLAMRSGPLCEEALYGVLVVLEGVEIAMAKTEHNDSSNISAAPAGDDDDEMERSKNEVKTPISYTCAKSIIGGMVVTTLRSGIRCALLTRPVRIMEGHLRLTLHSSLAGLGALYAVLSKRRGSVLSDTMVDGTDLILITASLPQAESFRLSSELLEKSSGEVTAPELVFSHWAVLDEDPFWIPTSLEEREDYGEIVSNGDLSTGVDNNALRYIRMTRKRKGLLVDSNKIVIAAEKQRTLGMNK